MKELATLKDIARETGFSVTTVSRALNGYFDVSEGTRTKIEQTAKRLGYSPNIIARSLVTKQSKTIGFIVTDLKRESIKDNFMYETLCGVSDTLASTTYEFVVLSTSTAKQKNKTYRQICAERQLDGVVIQGLKIEDPYLIEAMDSDTPCVLIDIPIEGEKAAYVTSNQFESAKQAVKYLRRMGHEKIAYMNGSEHAHVSQIRKRAYEEALRETGVELDPALVVNGDFEEEMARRAALHLLLNRSDVSAFFCASDVMALGVMQAAKELGIQIPKDLSVIGFDNILLSRYITPKLTTISQQPYEMGSAAAEMLIQLIEGHDGERQIELKNELILRESTSNR